MDLQELPHSRAVCAEVEYLAARAIESMDGLAINESLPGLGICSDLSVTLDPMGLGRAFFARRDTVLLVNLQMASAKTGQLYCPLIGGKSLGLGGHSKQGLVEATLSLLENHVACLDMPRLRESCALICGDGQIAKGGVLSRHSSTGSAEAIWEAIYGDAACFAAPMMADWGLMHRESTAFDRAVKRVPASFELIDVVNVLDKVLCMGEGKTILRGAAAHLGLPAPTLHAPGGTRMFVYFNLKLMRNFAAVTAALHCRLAPRLQSGIMASYDYVINWLSELIRKRSRVQGLM